MASIQGEARTLGKPRWMKDFGGREHILPFPLKVDHSQFSDGSGVRVVANGAAANGTDEIQSVTIAAAGGTFKLIYAGQTTGAIAFDAPASDVENALEALSTIGEGNVKVSGAAGGPFTVTFINALGNQNIAPMTSDPALLTGGANTAVVATVTPGVAGAAAIVVDALSGPIPAGTLLNFGGSKYATVTADVAAGATSVPVSTLGADIADNDVAIYSRYGRKYIPSGMYIGRTIAEAAAKTAFGPAVSTDDERYLIVFEIADATRENDAEAYRHGGVVAYNHLPAEEQARITADAGLLAKLRADYVVITAED